MTVSGFGAMRASDADREQVQTLLQTAYADGRLDLNEFTKRTEAAQLAKTYGHLSELTTDLAPVPVRPVPSPANTTNQMAIVSLACGAGQILFWIFSGIPAIVFGHLARRQIRRTGEAGAGLATVGMVLGYVGLGLFVVSAFVFVVILRWVLK